MAKVTAIEVLPNGAIIFGYDNGEVYFYSNNRKKLLTKVAFPVETMKFSPRDIESSSVIARMLKGFYNFDYLACKYINFKNKQGTLVIIGRLKFVEDYSYNHFLSIDANVLSYHRTRYGSLVNFAPLTDEHAFSEKVIINSKVEGLFKKHDLHNKFGFETAIQTCHHAYFLKASATYLFIGLSPNGQLVVQQLDLDKGIDKGEVFTEANYTQLFCIKYQESLLCVLFNSGTGTVSYFKAQTLTYDNIMQRETVVVEEIDCKAIITDFYAIEEKGILYLGFFAENKRLAYLQFKDNELSFRGAKTLKFSVSCCRYDNRLQQFILGTQAGDIEILDTLKLETNFPVHSFSYTSGEFNKISDTNFKFE